ncbi:hypothetical protein Efla_006832 [Eimeria flavescens]
MNQQQQQLLLQQNSNSSKEGQLRDACASRKHVLAGTSGSNTSSSSSSSKSSKGIDYSKWDHIGDDEEEEASPAPRVRRLTGDQSVTIGPDGLEIHHKPASAGAAAADAAQQQQQLQQWVEEERQEELEEMGMSFEDAHEWPRCGPAPIAELPAAAAAAADAAAAAAGAAACLASGVGDSELRQLIRNGGVCEKHKYFWSQSANELKLVLQLPFGVRGRDLRVHLTQETLRIACIRKALPCSSTSTSSSSSSSGSSSRKGEEEEEVLLEGHFPHPIEEDEDSWIWEVTERRIDWQRLQHLQQQQQEGGAATANSSSSSSSSSSGSGNLQQMEQRKLPLAAFFVDLHLRKKKILQGTDVWWPSVLKGEAGIDVSQLADRRHREETRSFKAAWEAAHAAFKDKVKQHKAPRMANLPDAAADAAADAANKPGAADQPSSSS